MAGTPQEKPLEFFAVFAQHDEGPNEVEDGNEHGGRFVDAGTNTAANADADDDPGGGGDTDSPPRARTLAADARAVDPARSRIVLVGAPAYADPQLPDVPQVAQNLRDLAAVFTDPKLGGFPAKHCVTVSPDAAAEEAEDLLLFYFAGHGLIGACGELFLALHDTRFRNPGYSGLRYDTVRDTHAGPERRSALSSSAPRQVLAARLALEQVIERDIKGVTDVARRVLTTAHSGAASVPDTITLRQRAINCLHMAEPTVDSVEKAADRAHVFAEISELLAIGGFPQTGRLAEKALELVPDIDNVGTRAQVKARACAPGSPGPKPRSASSNQPGQPTRPSGPPTT